MSLNVWIPRSARPTHFCRICKKPFFRGEDRARDDHAAECAMEHRDELQAAHEEARPPALFQPFDPEYADWAREHGRPG